MEDFTDLVGVVVIFVEGSGIEFVEGLVTVLVDGLLTVLAELLTSSEDSGIVPLSVEVVISVEGLASVSVQGMATALLGRLGMQVVDLAFAALPLEIVGSLFASRFCSAMRSRRTNVFLSNAFTPDTFAGSVSLRTPRFDRSRTQTAAAVPCSTKPDDAM